MVAQEQANIKKNTKMIDKASSMISTGCLVRKWKKDRDKRFANGSTRTGEHKVNHQNYRQGVHR